MDYKARPSLLWCGGLWRGEPIFNS